MQNQTQTHKQTSKPAIQHYYSQLHKIHQYSGAKNETSTRTPFVYLVNHYAEKKNLLLVTEVGVAGKKGNNVYPDGVLKNSLRLEFGHWEAKDTKDKFDYEIKKKLYEDGYPDRNILFEDTQTAVLIQNGSEISRVSMNDVEKLDAILNQYISYEPTQIKEFNKALLQFTKDIPDIVQNLRELIKKEAETNKLFVEKRDQFHQVARAEINSEVSEEDIREMLIQHILTEDIFNNVFNNASFHRYNNIARELEGVVNTFMNYGVRQNHLQSIKFYYDTIRDASAGLADHHEKQKFLKLIYENFYKVYNPKGADKLGVVYTPNEIVKFMIDSTDWLLEKHFGKNLSDKGVDILDPATGTGTFITELINHININDLEYKYEHELHANEVAILPYYIANLNIEYSYQQRKQEYKEFKNICFVDTLDNNDGLSYSGQQRLLGGISSENAKRIKDQNAKRISVIIGNPPYNAKQANYNFQNSNRAYKEIDSRIKNTYIKEGTAQNQIVVYDMFTRFYRWSMDRLNDNGIIAFITNRTFIDSRAFDGFRKSVQNEFDSIYIVDLRSDVRANPKIAGTSHNVFGIQTGVAIAFLVKDSEKQKDNRECKIQYIELDDFWRKEKKLEWICENPISQIEFDHIKPDAKNNWINQTDNDWNSLLPLIDKDVKSGKSEAAIFRMFSRGVESGRDEWVYDLSENVLKEKVNFLVESYNKSLKQNGIDYEIKWTSSLEAYFTARRKTEYSEVKVINSLYRPFCKVFYYSDKPFSHRLTQNHFDIFGKALDLSNNVINFLTYGANKPFHCIASKGLADLHLTGDTQILPLYYYSENQKYENITDWALNQFQAHYSSTNGGQITKEDIFHYVYGVLHSPQYRKKYEQNLKREFPRLPFYEDFAQWRDWGCELMNLHINYETQEPFSLDRIDNEWAPKRKVRQRELFSTAQEILDESFVPKSKTKLRADKANGIIEIDTKTSLTGIPSSAWEYKLGNRSALEWVLDQYKESKPKDATIAKKFNTYKFEDYKEHVIDLLCRVCTVSVRTAEIVNQMQNSEKVGTYAIPTKQQPVYRDV